MFFSVDGQNGRRFSSGSPIVRARALLAAALSLSFLVTAILRYSKRPPPNPLIDLLMRKLSG